MWLRGEGHIIITWWGAAVIIEKPPAEAWHMVLVALSGGLTVAAFYFTLFYWDIHNGDIEESAALLPHACSQLAYGLFEASFFWLPFEQFFYWAVIVITTSLIAGLLLGWYILVRHWVSEGLI